MSPSKVTLVNKPIGPIGYGLMGLTWRATPPSQSQSFSAMTAALSNGSNFWNGGELYGTPDRHSCHLLHEYFTANPEAADKIVLSIKGGLVKGGMAPDGSEANVRRSVEDCLAVLKGSGKNTIDIFECARVDPKVPIEDTVATLGKLVSEGKIGGIGLSEVKASTIARAAKVHPIAAVEVELSLWSPDILFNGVATACARHGIPVVAYSPLSRGALTGTGFKSNAEIPADSFLKTLPKFQDDVLSHNNRITELVETIAKTKGATKAQVAIGWVRAMSGRKFKDPETGDEVTLGTIIPIPGATTKERVDENMKIVELSDGEVEELMDCIKNNPSKGDRYMQQAMHFAEG